MLRHGLCRWALLAVASQAMVGCQKPRVPVRVGSVVWLGYEPMFLARELGYLDDGLVRLVEHPSSTSSLMALATGDVDAATLTLDELLLAREGGLDLRVILVFDTSNGADAVMARPGISDVRSLKNKRVAVEDTAVGALMLAQLLDRANLGPSDVVKVPVTADRQLAAYQSGQVDVVVAFEPHVSQLRKLGAVNILDSSQFPGLIVDVLAAHASALETKTDAIRQLILGYFKALKYLGTSPDQACRLMAPRLGISADAVTSALAGIHLLAEAENLAWLKGASPLLGTAAGKVASIMQGARMLKVEPDLRHLHDPRFIPEPR